MPERIVTVCPQCKIEAVCLQILNDPSTEVFWCADGHIIVSESEMVKLVYQVG